MSTEDQEDIEEKWENAVFEVCDARERFPKRCAEELGRYLNCKNIIAMQPVVLKPSPQIFEIPQIVYAQEIRSSQRGVDARLNRGNKDERLKNMMDKIQELKIALKQLEDNKNFEIKHHLK